MPELVLAFDQLITQLTVHLDKHMLSVAVSENGKKELFYCAVHIYL